MAIRFFITGLVAYFGGENIGHRALQIITQDIIFPAAGFFFAVYSALRIVDHTSVGTKISRQNVNRAAIIIMLVLFCLYLIIPYLFLHLDQI